jgi:hypothetical protein
MRFSYCVKFFEIGVGIVYSCVCLCCVLSYGWFIGFPLFYLSEIFTLLFLICRIKPHFTIIYRILPDWHVYCGIIRYKSNGTQTSKRSEKMKTTPANQMVVALHAIGKDQLEMTDVERDLYLSPQMLEDAETEINRLRDLVIRLAKNELSETEKAILLS